MIKKTEKPLIETNPYLRDPKDRQIQFFTAVVGSTGIEGVTITSGELRKPAKQTTKRK
jgi:hypothetical protein